MPPDSCSSRALCMANSRHLLLDLLSRRILILDGSMGALLFSHQPTEDDYRGTRFRAHPVSLKNCTEAMVLSQPRRIEEIHRAYLEAGADIIETDTFNATPFGLAEYGLGEHVFEINQTAVELARRAADDFTRRNPDRPRFVAGSIGPTNKTLYIEPGHDPATRSRSFDDFVANYTAQIEGLVAGGVDLIALETANDILVLKAGLFALDKYFAEHGVRLPVIVSGTIYHPSGRTLFSQTPEAFYVSVA